MKRVAQIRRKTIETDISIKLDIDGEGKAEIKTGINFMDHMLNLFVRHGLFNIAIRAKGDLKLGIHHTNEDIGICLGQAFKKALANRRGIRRWGFSCLPMDEALVQVTCDISARPYLIIKTSNSKLKEKEIEGYNLDYTEQFLQAFVANSGITLHVHILSGKDIHHTLEALFKALSRALDEATQIDPRIKGVPSTKGKLT